jgi:hypothetical protein
MLVRVAIPSRKRLRHRFKIPTDRHAIPTLCQEEKPTLDSLASSLQKMGARMREGFAKQGKEIHDLTSSVSHVVKSVARIEETMATKDDLAAVEKRPDERIDGLTVKVDAIQKSIDSEAMQRSDLPTPPPRP